MKPRVAIGRLALARTSEILPLTQHPSPSRNKDDFITDEIERAEYWERLVFPASWERILRNSENCR